MSERSTKERTLDLPVEESAVIVLGLPQQIIRKYEEELCLVMWESDLTVPLG